MLKEFAQTRHLEHVFAFRSRRTGRTLCDVVSGRWSRLEHVFNKHVKMDDIDFQIRWLESKPALCSYFRHFQVRGVQLVA